jgi:hypothetical protein
MDGDPNTIKLDVLITVTPLTVTAIGPVVAPAGTRVVSVLAEDAVTFAGTPLKVTTLLAGVALKFVPEITTVAPGAPLDKLNPVMVGEGAMVKSLML